jgi:hypothetical protein
MGEGVGGIAVNLRIEFQIFSPPFEGGVAGTTDYLKITKLISRPGWLILSFLLVYLRETITSLRDKALYALIITEE